MRRRRVPMFSDLASPARSAAGRAAAGLPAAGPVATLDGSAGESSTVAPGRPLPFTPRITEDALFALQDAFYDARECTFPSVRLATLALDAELLTSTQRQLLGCLLYEIADAVRTVTPA